MADAPKSNFHLSIRGTCKDHAAVDAAVLAFVERLKTEFGCEFADGRLRTLSEHAFGEPREQVRKTHAERRAERRTAGSGSPR